MLCISIIIYQKEIFHRTAFCVDTYILKTIHHIVRKELEEKFGVVVCFPPEAARWHHAIIASQGGRGGRVLFCSLSASVLIVWKQFPQNQILTSSGDLSICWLEKVCSRTRISEWRYAVGLDVAKRSLDRPTWAPVAVMGKNSFYHRWSPGQVQGNQRELAARRDTRSGGWSSPLHLRRGPFCVLHYLKVVINGEIHFSTFFSLIVEENRLEVQEKKPTD